MSNIVDALRASYDSVAAAYVEHIYDELRQKPLDRHLLNRFAEEVRARGTVADLGCGPGHVARYLSDQGIQTVGVDLSPEMIRQAARLNPALTFHVGDMRSLELSTGSLAGIIAFYSLIHFSDADLKVALRECHRVLAPTGVLLAAFHIGDHTIHRDELWGQPVALDFRFLRPAEVVACLQQEGFDVTETVEREPYYGAENPSRRCYLFARIA